MFGRSARDAAFAIVILAGYVIGTKNQATVATLYLVVLLQRTEKLDTSGMNCLACRSSVQFPFF